LRVPRTLKMRRGVYSLRGITRYIASTPPFSRSNTGDRGECSVRGNVAPKRKCDRNGRTTFKSTESHQSLAHGFSYGWLLAGDGYCYPPPRLNCVSLADLSAGGYRDHPRLARDFLATDSARERFLSALTILWAVYFVEGAPRCTYDSGRSPGPPLRC
jgi:hypothetical protein